MNARPHLLIFIGTRAQLIKMAPVMLALEKRGLTYRLIFTGQHKETMQTLLADFGITARPDYLYQGREVTGILQMLFWFLRCLSTTLVNEKLFLSPEAGDKRIILVHGDTFSTLLGAVIGKLKGIRVAHIEAGLRSYSILNPFPEELTRLAIFRLSHYAFCPGEWAFNNMQDYAVKRINTQENTLLDSLRIATEKNVPLPHRFLNTTYGVCSIHRFENIFFKTRLKHIVSLIESASLQYPVLFVLHPATRNRLLKVGLMSRLENNPRIQTLPRMGYVEFISLIRRSRFVITDGGGNQEELSYMGTPTLLMRAATERNEGVGTTAVLCRYDLEILRQFMASLSRPSATPTLTTMESPAEIIADYLGSGFSLLEPRIDTNRHE